jgi:hypothetical protein
MVDLDNFITGVRDGNFLSKNKFNLLTYDGDGNVVSIVFTSVYVIVDNGYLPCVLCLPF